MKETNKIIVKEGSKPDTTYVVDVTNPVDVHKTADKVHLQTLVILQLVVLAVCKRDMQCKYG